MVNSLTTHLATYESVTRVYESATRQWWGCNWRTEFGSRKLNLCDVRSRQARLMANATSGDESSAWEQATRYLAEVEVDARNAERAAAHAISMVDNGRWRDALSEMDIAVKLESKYRESIVWRPLRNEITAIPMRK